jgi:CBS domain-containing protein
VVSITDEVSVIDAYHKLIEHKILSVPVQNAKTHAFYAFLDVLDIVCHAVDILTEAEMKEGFDITLAKIEFGRYKVSQLAGYSNRNPFHTISKHATVEDALKLFTRTFPTHRVAVVDDDGKSLVSILTQSQLVRWLSSHIAATSWGKNTVSQLRLGYKPVVSIDVHSQASIAFKKMQREKVTALAVLDEHNSNQLVSAISASDLKSVGYDGTLLDRLFLPLNQFLGIKANSAAQSRLVTVDPNTSIAQTFQTVVSHGVHRAFVIQEHMQLLGVVSLSDLLAEVESQV